MNSDKYARSARGSEVSLVRGGPFYRAQQAIGLIHPNQWNLGRRIAVAIVISWLPLFVLTALLNFKGLDSLFRDYRVHGRLLIAVPVLLLGEVLMETRFRAVLSHIRQAGLLEEPDLEYMDGVLATLLRSRDAYLSELAILVLVIIRIVASYKGLVDPTPWLARGTMDNLQLSTAGWYAVLVSAPIFDFLLGLSLWKWLLWVIYAFKLSRRKLKLVPTHPDQHGGVGFLSLTTAAFAPVAFAASTVIGATWRYDILHHGAHLMDFKLPTIALVIIVVFVALGPLIFLVPRLAVLRTEGILEYGILGQFHSRDFHEKWILHRSGHEVEFLQAPESSRLADYDRVYEKIEQLNPFPANKEDLIPLLLAVAIPAFPVIIAQIPIAIVLKDLFHALR
ncbi:MAG: hypothetical protein WBQ89_16555 [Candidatus Acidiferrum sp.]